MTTYQIKQMICEQIIVDCENVANDLELINFKLKSQYSDDLIERDRRNLDYHIGRRDSLKELYEMIKKEDEKIVQQLSIPDQAYDSIKSLD